MLSAINARTDLISLHNQFDGIVSSYDGSIIYRLTRIEFDFSCVRTSKMSFCILLVLSWALEPKCKLMISNCVYLETSLLCDMVNPVYTGT